MDEPILTWRAARHPHTGKPIPDEGELFDDHLQVGTVGLGRVGTMNGVWGWSMPAYGRGMVQDLSYPRSGLAGTREEAKAACEAAYRALLALAPDNRATIFAGNAACEERTRLWETGEGMKLSMEATERRIKLDRQMVLDEIARRER
ncbi:hypothetical protein [Enterovirga aerilata]|uniref:Uncharacterized protein n=1 Tax=Enterovirga aerilata TaxID=2730920 RepID=A0A849IFZ9_9HYPH|nr:hypothetical protein [Enterovirga sp. DB1703]NNM75090.1 hypothetical protein [Enterovirga sp. DB1703]